LVLELCGERAAPKEGVGDVIGRALEGRPRPPYIGWRALGYKLVSIYPSQLQYGSLIRTTLNCLDCLVLYTKLSSCPWAHMSGRVGSTDRSAGLLVG
jgi:hypothetical protein